MTNQEKIRLKFPLLAHKIIEICEERLRAENVDAFQIFFDLEEVVGVHEAMSLLSSYTLKTLDQLEEIEEEEDERE